MSWVTCGHNHKLIRCEICKPVLCERLSMSSITDETLSASLSVEPVYPDRLNFGTNKPQLNKRKSSPASIKENLPTKIRRIDSEAEEFSDDLGASKQTEESVDSMDRSDQLDGAHNTEQHITMYQGTGNITLWQFLLNMLLSNEHPDLICWTETEGEFILLQPENVAKLWGLRKDPNHCMTYDKLGRSLRQYYQKNIIRKVNRQKYVYQFIDLPKLIKLNNELRENEYRRAILREERSNHKPDGKIDRASPLGTHSSMNKPDDLQCTFPQMNQFCDLMKSNIQQSQDNFQLGNVGDLLKEQTNKPLDHSSPLISDDLNSKYSNLLSYISSIISLSNLLKSVPADTGQNGYGANVCVPEDRDQLQTPISQDTTQTVAKNTFGFLASAYNLNSLSSSPCFGALNGANYLLSQVNMNAVQPTPKTLHRPHERPSSPGCQCSCHVNLPASNTIDSRGDNNVEPSVPLHKSLPEINIQQLEAQISRLHNSNGLAASGIPSFSTEQTNVLLQNLTKTHSVDLTGMKGQYVWMPVPISMLEIWSTLLGFPYQVPATCENSPNQSNPHPSTINGSLFSILQQKNQM